MCDFKPALTVNEGLRRPRLDGEGSTGSRSRPHDDYEATPDRAEVHAIQTARTWWTLRDGARHRMRSLDFVMPDVQRIGGVSGWLRAAALAHATASTCRPSLPEFSVTCSGEPTATGSSTWTGPRPAAEPLRVKNESPRSRTGPPRHRLDEDAVKRYAA